MIYTVNLNPSFDYVKRFDQNGNPYYKIIFGGKANNIAKLVAYFKKDAVFAVTFSDSQYFSFINDYLDARYVEHKLFLADGEIRKYNKIGIEKEMFNTGIILDYQKLDEVVDFLNSKLKDDDILCLCGSLPQVCPKNAYQYILKRIENNNIKIFMDTRYEFMESCLDRHIIAIKPNEEEILDFIPGFNYQSEESKKALRKFYDSHNIDHIIVSLGKDGLYYVGKNEEIYLRTKDVEVLSTVACGDVLFGTFIYDHYVLNLPLKEALFNGLAISTVNAHKQEEGSYDEYIKTIKEIKELNK